MVLEDNFFYLLQFRCYLPLINDGIIMVKMSWYSNRWLTFWGVLEQRYFLNHVNMLHFLSFLKNIDLPLGPDNSGCVLALSLFVIECLVPFPGLISQLCFWSVNWMISQKITLCSVCTSCVQARVRLRLALKILYFLSIFYSILTF